MVDQIKLQKIVALFREQLEWKVKEGEGFHNHIIRCLEIPENAKLEPEEFVLHYRLKYKPKYPDHPTGGAIVDGHYGRAMDMFVFVGLPEN